MLLLPGLTHQLIDFAQHKVVHELAGQGGARAWAGRLGAMPLLLIPAPLRLPPPLPRLTATLLQSPQAHPGVILVHPCPHSHHLSSQPPHVTASSHPVIPDAGPNPDGGGACRGSVHWKGSSHCSCACQP
uniref:Uncharacterized protein n=1 Tax=Pipistrellus kuhlii TaxID=59472 RepID=A0A7J7V0Q1_PIPKU|nr:hypothetical protein mPipKuh1_008634 [Pipistrellus kuhlii]